MSSGAVESPSQRQHHLLVKSACELSRLSSQDQWISAVIQTMVRKLAATCTAARVRPALGAVDRLNIHAIAYPSATTNHVVRLRRLTSAVKFAGVIEVALEQPERGERPEHQAAELEGDAGGAKSEPDGCGTLGRPADDD